LPPAPPRCRLGLIGVEQQRLAGVTRAHTALDALLAVALSCLVRAPIFSSAPPREVQALPGIAWRTEACHSRKVTSQRNVISPLN
jgi:hypothetical protein